MAEAGHSRSTTRSVVWILVAIVLVGAAARVLWIDRCALHNDEALQLNGIKTASFEMLLQHLTRIDMHPPLSYLVQKVFHAMSPTTGSLRGASALLGTLAIPAMFWAFLPILGTRRSLLTAALTAVSYELIWYSRELRGYVFLFFFALLACGYFVRLLMADSRKMSWGNLLGFIVANVLALYSHYGALLIWPLYAAVLGAWELERGRSPSRWRRIICLGASGLVVVLLCVPAFVLLARWQWITGKESVRPTLQALYWGLAPMGFGARWGFALWAAILVLGCWRAFSLGRRIGLFLAVWIGVPLVGYLYLKGMPSRYVDSLSRYAIYLLLGFLPLQALGYEQIAVWTGRDRGRVVGFVCAALVAIQAVLMAPAFRNYYSMRSVGHLFHEVQKDLEETGSRAVLLDNYYEIQYLRHYLPQTTRIANTPIWNNTKDFLAMDTVGFVKRVAGADPLIVFYDSNARRSSPPGAWDWLDSHFEHKKEFANTRAEYLYRRGLNLFPILFNYPEMQTIRLYYNDPETLPSWFADRGLGEGTAYGGDWYHLTIRGGGGEWRHWRVADRLGTIYVYNGAGAPVTRRIALDLHGCVEGQRVVVRKDGKTVLKNRVLGNGPAQGIDMRTRQRFSQHVPLGALFRQQGGMLNLPVAVHLPFDSVDMGEVSLAAGMNTFVIECARPEGIVLGRVELSPSRE